MQKKTNERMRIMNLNFSFLSKYWPMFVRGAGTTLILSFFTVLIGLIIGVLLALLRLGKFKPLSFLSAAYTEFIRGTPLMVQIFFIFYASSGTAHSFAIPCKISTPCTNSGKIYLSDSLSAFGLPGKFTINVCLRIPAAALDSIARFVNCIL